MISVLAAAPDLTVTIEDMIVERDKMMCRNVWRWTSLTTGKMMEFKGFVLWRFVGNKLPERWATLTEPKERSILSAATREGAKHE